jgi:hypothetical protein
MRIVGLLVFATLLLSLAAQLRAPEYDEAYSIFLTAGDPRPSWPQGVFRAGDVRGFYDGHAGPGEIAHDLRVGDVHPPLYFWALDYWRRLTGPSWFAARMLSVGFSVAALGVLAGLALRAEVPVAATLLLTLLSYGFAYTGIVARGFALAQFLNIVGVYLVCLGTKDRRWGLCFGGGLAFGAAGFSNYLAIFVGLGTVWWLMLRAENRKMLVPAGFGLGCFLPAIGTFFLSQRNSRVGQFVPFSLPHEITLLAKCGGAALFGGLPVYAGAAGAAVRLAVAWTLALLIVVCAGFVVRDWQPKSALFAIAAVATPIGLLGLGFIFDNSPIEIRYLAFSLPFVALLLAQTLPRYWLWLVLGVQVCGIAGLIVAPETMQPQGLAARQLRAFITPGTLVLLPFGNDGVGIPGPFIASVPDDLRLQLVKPGPWPKLAGERHVVVVTLRIDAASAQTGGFPANSCWVQTALAKYLKVFVRRCHDY